LFSFQPRIQCLFFRARKEFPQYPPLLLNAISMGRRVLDPLFEYSSLWGTKDILYLKLHPLQGMVPEHLLMEKLERSFLNVVSRVGVDINDAVKFRHHSHILQFVPGLGPRKAVSLLSSISSKGLLELRQDLKTIHSLENFVLINCSAFLQI